MHRPVKIVSIVRFINIYKGPAANCICYRPSRFLSLEVRTPLPHDQRTIADTDPFYCLPHSHIRSSLAMINYHSPKTTFTLIPV
jgi:hypothetical protein